MSQQSFIYLPYSADLVVSHGRVVWWASTKTPSLGAKAFFSGFSPSAVGGTLRVLTSANLRTDSINEPQQHTCGTLRA